MLHRPIESAVERGSGQIMGSTRGHILGSRTAGCRCGLLTADRLRARRAEIVIGHAETQLEATNGIDRWLGSSCDSGFGFVERPTGLVAPWRAGMVVDVDSIDIDDYDARLFSSPTEALSAQNALLRCHDDRESEAREPYSPVATIDPPGLRRRIAALWRCLTDFSSVRVL